jgi:hypothetical protein
MTTRRGLRPAPILTTNDKEKRDMALKARPTTFEITGSGNVNAPLVVRTYRHSPGTISLETSGGPFLLNGQEDIDTLARRLRKYLRDNPALEAGDDSEEETHG